MLSVQSLKRLHLGPLELTLLPRELVALSGSSGAGKTVFLRAIADLDPNEGSVELEGVERSSIPAPQWRKKVCYLQTDSGWWDPDVGAHFSDLNEAPPLLKKFKLPDDILTWSISRLSTGEKQRLALARLLLRSPRIMLLDEPTSGLDPETTLIVENLLKQRAKDGTAIIFVTHDADQANRLATRTLTLQNGVLSP